MVILGLLVSPAFQQEPRQFETFQIELVAAPVPTPSPPVTEDLVIETPDPAPPAEPEAIPPPESTTPPIEAPEEVPVEEEDDPEEEVEEPEETTDETPPPPTPAPAEQVDEAPDEDTGSDVTVRLEGLRRDYPQYYAGIVQAISDCFRPPRGNNRWEAVIYFEIQSDGTVSGVRPVQRSGSQAFDLAAIGAVADCAGRGRFGALPEELPYEVLPVQFTFRPRGIG